MRATVRRLARRSRWSTSSCGSWAAASSLFAVVGRMPDPAVDQPHLGGLAQPRHLRCRPGQRLRPHRPRIHPGLRRPAHDQLRPRRRVHVRRDDLLLRRRSLAQAGFLNANPIIGDAIVLLVAALSSMIVAVLLERIAYRPLRRAPRLVPLITAIGASLFISNSVRGLYGEQVKAWPRIDALEGTIDILGIPILKTQAVVIVAAIVMMAFLYWFVNRTRTGRAMRAVSENKDTAALMGIDVDRTIVDHLRHRRPAGWRRRGPVRDRLLPGPLDHGLPARHQGLHRRGARRDRQYRRRHARRPVAGRPRVGGAQPAPRLASASPPRTSSRTWWPSPSSSWS